MREVEQAMTDQTHNLILDIYDTVANQALWPMVLDKLADSIDARGCIVFEMQGNGSDRTIHAPLVSKRYDPTLLLGYLDRFGLEDSIEPAQFETFALAASLAISDEASENTTPPASQPAKRPNVRLSRAISPSYRHARPAGNPTRNRVRFSVQFNPKQGPLSGENRAKLNTYLPHLAKAVELGRPLWRMAAAHESLVQAVEHLQIGICIVDDLQRPIFSNAEFQRQQKDHAAFCLDAHGRLIWQSTSVTGPQSGYAKQLDDFGTFERKDIITVGPKGQESALCIALMPLGERSASSNQLSQGV